MFDAYNEYLNISRQHGDKNIYERIFAANDTTLQILLVYKVFTNQ